jgi:hypothetical protein
MYAQLDLQAISKTPQKEEPPSNFHEFWIRKFHFEKKKTLMFDSYYLMDLIEKWIVSFRN